MSSIEEKIINDLVLYARTGKAAELLECLAQFKGDLGFIWGDYTLLGHAAERGRLETVEVLLEKGADPNKAGRYGHTPLMLAAWSKSLPCVKRLIEAGADAAAVSRDENLTAYGYAVRRSAKDVAAFLKQYDPRILQIPDFALLSSLDPNLVRKLESFTKKIKASGMRGIVQPLWESSAHPDWYLRVLAAIPLAGVQFVSSPPGHPFDEEGTFLTITEMAEFPEEEPYLTQPFAEAAIAPIALGSDGNYWAISVLGDHTTPVYIWNHSAADFSEAYSNFTEFLDAAKLC